MDNALPYGHALRGRAARSDPEFDPSVAGPAAFFHEKDDDAKNAHAYRRTTICHRGLISVGNSRSINFSTTSLSGSRFVPPESARADSN